MGRIPQPRLGAPPGLVGLVSVTVMPAPAFPPAPPRWRRAAVVGGALATVLFAWVVLIGRAELTAAPTGDFYDLQVRAWFDGRWDIEDRIHPDTGQPYNPLSIEAIVVDGRSYLYYGPVPALLRTPLAAVTSGTDGRTTQPFMLAAFVVLLGGANALGWRIRCLVRASASPATPASGASTGPDASVHTESLSAPEVWLAGATTFVVGAGTVALYLGSQPTVYHEATLWGLAFGLWAYALVLDATVTTTVRTVAWAGVLTTLALLSRASVGIGPLVGLGLLLVVVTVRALRRRLDEARPLAEARPAGEAGAPENDPPTGTAASLRRHRRVLGALVGACVVPVVLYAAVNQARFGEPLRLPLEKQVYSQIDQERIAALEANDGSLFSAAYLPSTVLQYARPDALRFDALAPWLVFPRQPATVVGGATFDTRDVSSSVPATMPLWTVLAGVGAVAVARDLLGRRGRLGPLWVPAAGAIAGTGGVLTIGFIANRYLGDLLPLLLVLGLAGLHVTLRWATTRPSAVRRALVATATVAALWGVAANLALALEYQRLIAPVDPATRVAFVSWQHTLGDTGDRVSVGEPPGRHEVAERGWRYVLLGPDGGCWWSDGTSAQRLGDPDSEVCRRIGLPDDATSDDATPDAATPPDAGPTAASEADQRSGTSSNRNW
jgi:hypothetical protein